MNALAELLGLAVKDGVLVLRKHLLLLGHLGLPTFEGLERLALFRERSVERGHDLVDSAQAHAVAALLELGQAPWDLP